MAGHMRNVHNNRSGPPSQPPPPAPGDENDSGIGVTGRSEGALAAHMSTSQRRQARPALADFLPPPPNEAPPPAPVAECLARSAPLHRRHQMSLAQSHAMTMHNNNNSGQAGT